MTNTTRNPARWILWGVAGGLLAGVLITSLVLLSPVGPSLFATMAHSADSDHAEGQLWTCGMHPHVMEDQPGLCPICNMDLVPLRGTGANKAAEEKELAQHWTCSMHPQILEDAPGDCPICGMDLVSAKQASPEPASDHEAVVQIDASVRQNMNVVVEPVERRDLTRTIRTVGYLDYDQQRMVSVTTKYQGYVEKVFVNHIGQPVRKGETLFEVYSPELVQTEEELLSTLDYARRMASSSADAAARATELVDAARRRLTLWDVSPEQIAELERTGKVFRTLKVMAQADGVVMKRMPGLEGMAVRPGMELMHIADLSSLWLKVEVFESQLAWIDDGSQAAIELTYLPGQEFRGRVAFVEPSVSPETRTISLTLEVPNRSGKLRAGMYATVVFEPVVAREAIAVSSEAVIRSGTRNIVVVALGGGRFAPREVDLGAEGDGWVQVLSGLSDQDKIVTSSQFLIDSESSLQAAIQKMISAHHDRK